ncbi:hypothetical protein [Thalassospira sp.]|uniref:hypothetical protein n=1 Tax=Thalassospira sp. TaxID=1912094 RepID=UPI001B0AA5C8|nr:hypothetical protein [Thalassospira sp.]MBO6807703.1 hypothetical protein [Thalassospira sp.]MBO6840228.1 hypothetical protein [Thalassospira sp.]
MISSTSNPWEAPGWHAISREAQLAKHLLGTGATAIGKANYANLKGEYYNAFFGLSIGVERLAKLILIADYAVRNNGDMPTESVIRKFGHKLFELLNEVEAITNTHGLQLQYVRPSSIIVEKIIECLDSFANASKGRYANFSGLGEPTLIDHDPVSGWWEEVCELILIDHYYGKRVQKSVEQKAKLVDSFLSPMSQVLYFDERAERIDDVYTGSVRTGQTEVTQKYGRYYVLLVIRWLSDMFSSLARKACYEFGYDAFYGVWEHFETYTVEDQFLKTRKRWPLR